MWKFDSDHLWSRTGEADNGVWVSEAADWGRPVLLACFTRVGRIGISPLCCQMLPDVARLPVCPWL